MNTLFVRAIETKGDLFSILVILTGEDNKIIRETMEIMTREEILRPLGSVNPGSVESIENNIHYLFILDTMISYNLERMDLNIDFKVHHLDRIKYADTPIKVYESIIGDGFTEDRMCITTSKDKADQTIREYPDPYGHFCYRTQEVLLT